MILALLNIGSTAAFGAFIALASLALFASYFIAISCMVSARCRKDPIKFGQWTLGRWGMPINIFALIYTAYVSIFLCFPSTLPVTGANMNYALPIFAFVVFLAIGWWFAWGKAKWSGLSAQIIALVVEDGKLVLNKNEEDKE